MESSHCLEFDIICEPLCDEFVPNVSQYFSQHFPVHETYGLALWISLSCFVHTRMEMIHFLLLLWDPDHIKMFTLTWENWLGLGGLVRHLLLKKRINLEFSNHSSLAPGRLDNWHRKERKLTLTQAMKLAHSLLNLLRQAPRPCTCRGGSWAIREAALGSLETGKPGWEPRTQPKANSFPTSSLLCNLKFPSHASSYKLTL